MHRITRDNPSEKTDELRRVVKRSRKEDERGKVGTGISMSLDSFIARPKGNVGALFKCNFVGDTKCRFPGGSVAVKVSPASADLAVGGRAPQWLPEEPARAERPYQRLRAESCPRPRRPPPIASPPAGHSRPAHGPSTRRVPQGLFRVTIGGALSLREQQWRPYRPHCPPRDRSGCRAPFHTTVLEVMYASSERRGCRARAARGPNM
jgi:hypothetical protein